MIVEKKKRPEYNNLCINLDFSEDYLVYTPNNVNALFHACLRKQGKLTMQDTVLNLLNSTGLAWWVEVTTEEPSCTYYFGPFMKESNAQTALPGYVEDLEKEGAIGIRAITKRCKPEQLTIIHDELAESKLEVPLNASIPE